MIGTDRLQTVDTNFEKKAQTLSRSIWADDTVIWNMPRIRKWLQVGSKPKYIFTCILSSDKQVVAQATLPIHRSRREWRPRHRSQALPSKAKSKREGCARWLSSDQPDHGIQPLLSSVRSYTKGLSKWHYIRLKMRYFFIFDSKCIYCTVAYWQHWSTIYRRGR